MKNKILELPKNIKQIGNIEQNQKIYIEDYVFTYLQNYSKEGGLSDRIAILVGEVIVVDGEKIIFINGAIKGKHTEQKNGICTFTEECFDYIEEQLDKYFKSSILLGWFYSQPECSDYLNEAYTNYHEELFREKVFKNRSFQESTKIFLLSDYIENTYVFHKYNQVKDKLEQLQGFIIYYEKNEQMNEYMLANKSLDEKNEQDRYKIKDEMLTSYTRGEKSMNKLAEKNRKTLNFLSSLSAGLIILCFMMGSSLIQSDDRITQLEERLVNLDESYRYVLSQIKNDNVQSVFANNIGADIENLNNSNSNIGELESENITEKIIEEDMTENITENITKDTIGDILANTTDEYLEKNSEVITENITENIIESITENITEETTISSTTISKIDEKELNTYRVKQGDTLESISNKLYGSRVKIEEIMQINNLEDSNKIFIDMILKLPN